MKIATEYQRLAQEILKKAGVQIIVDGIFGPGSDAAADKFRGVQLTPEAHVAFLVQEAFNVWAASKGRDAITVDGRWGPATMHAADELIAARDKVKLPTRPDDLPGANVPSGQCHDGSCSAVKCWTPTDAQMESYYGAVGSHQRLIAVPFPLVLDWDPSTIVKRITVHEKVAEDVQGALEGILAHYGIEQLKALGLDRFGGSLNVRKKRGGSTWSAHAWGTALDFWPEVNALRESHKTARFARAEYVPYFRIWEDHGFMSLGRCFDFDWMHVQKNPPR